MPRTIPQRYNDNSPFYKIDRTHTPLMIVAGDADGACPPPEGAKAYFVGLRRLRSASRTFLIYPDDGHAISY